MKVMGNQKKKHPSGVLIAIVWLGSTVGIWSLIIWLISLI